MLKNITTIVLIIIAILLFAFYIRPSFDNIQDLTLKQAEYESALENARKLQSIREDLLEKRNSISSADLARLGKLLPDNVDNVKLILELQTIAESHNLELQTASAKKEEEGQTRSAVSGVDIETKDYGIITLNFKLFGGYRDFVPFLEEVSETLRLTDVESISFSRSTSSKQEEGEENSYQYNLQLKTYWLKDNI